MPRKQIPLWFIFLAWALMFYQGLMAFDSRQGYGQRVEIPTRRVSVILSKGGYYPDVIQAFEGEKIEFTFTSTLGKPSCMIMPDKNLFIAARFGEIGKGELYVKKSGTYFFYCPSTEHQGKVVVLKNPHSDKEQRKASREIASESKAQWFPRSE